MSDYSVDRLPKWARDKIASLERDVARLTERTRGQLIAHDAPWTNVWLPAPQEARSFMDEPVKSGFRDAWFCLADPTTRFDRFSIQARVEADGGRPHLKVMGGSAIVIAPDVANVVRIYIED